MLQDVIQKKHRKFFLAVITVFKNADALGFLLRALHLYVSRQNNVFKYPSVLLVAHFRAQAFTACHRSVCYKGGHWKMEGAGERWPCIWEWGGMGVLITHLALVLANFTAYLTSVFLSVLTWKQILTFCTYIPLNVFFFSPPLIRDDGILEPFIIKRHNRSINFASVGLILAYTIKLW